MRSRIALNAQNRVPLSSTAIADELPTDDLEARARALFRDLQEKEQLLSSLALPPVKPQGRSLPRTLPWRDPQVSSKFRSSTYIAETIV